MTSDFLTVLRHGSLKLAKTWRADGTVAPYDEPKQFRHERLPVDSLQALSMRLALLESDAHACVIRGEYRGDEHARANDPQYERGRVRRTKDNFVDAPHRWLMIDIDAFEPLAADPLDEPEACALEFVLEHLPEPFHEASFHWQLSNTAGHATKAGIFKAHLWFWLADGATSGQLYTWAREHAPHVDKALFQTNQVHYTAGPVLDSGVECPVVQRHGFYDGLLGDEVLLDLSADDTTEALPTRQQRLQGARFSDPIAQRLGEMGLVKSVGADGRLNIECPFSAEHTDGKSSDTSTTYFPAHTGGYAQGHFKCLHGHCAERTRFAFLDAIGYDELGEGFEAVDPREPAQADEVVGPSRPDAIPEASHLTTHLANAGRLARYFGRQLAVVGGRWYAWNATHWIANEADVYRCAARLPKAILREAQQWREKEGDEGQRKAFGKIADALVGWAKRSEMRGDIEAVVALARKMLAVEASVLDRDPYALNCLNGTVDLRTGVLREHEPTDYITRIAPFEYVPGARCDVFERTLARITLEEGLGKRPLALFLQRWFGYCATGSTREQVFVVHWGSGSNGKSTIIDTVAAVLGHYATTAAPGLMTARREDRHPTEIADLFGRRMVTAHETDDGAVLREGFIKQATGGDRLKARHMHADFFEFDPTHKLQLLTNHRPLIKGSDHGIWRRVALVPYLARFGDASQVATGAAMFAKDTGLAAMLKSESEGILAWIVRGAVEWYRDGLGVPEVVKAASQDYQSSQDRFAQFLDECCEIGQTFEVPLSLGSQGLYPQYSAWCKTNGMQPLATPRFLQEIARCVPRFARRVTMLKDEFDGTRKKVQMIWGLKLLD